MAKATEKDHENGLDSDDFRFWEMLNSLIQVNPHEAWNDICAITLALTDPQHIAHIAAGPFEELLASQNINFEELFNLSDKETLERLLPFVWKTGLSSKAQVWMAKFTS